MPLESGQQHLHYRLVDRLGEGGMGEVWRATDTALDREVALKFLPDDFSNDPDRRARFEREAKLLASFSHPNIASVFGLHESAGLRFLSMELIPGEDLSQVLVRGALDVDEALGVALQISAALELAHENQVIHRDLKPANVCWTPEKVVKVLDFGLAKALEAGGPSQDPQLSPTVTSARTETGMVLGTAAYMSPEQARGKLVDRRADIWAFGCVLFELLTGKRAFPGETTSDTLVSVLSEEPDWSKLPPATPRVIRGLLERCLTKDSRRRLQDIGEARILLEDVNSGHAEDAPQEMAPKPSRRDGRRNVLIAVGAVVLFAAGTWLGGRTTTTDEDSINPDIRVRRITFSQGLAQEPSLSPDGNYVSYTTDEKGNLDIAVLPLSGGNANLVVDHPADDAQARWSPDGSRIAFVSARDRDGQLTSVGGLGALSRLIQGNGGDIFLSPALGGAVSKLVDQGLYPSWAPDGQSLAFQSDREDQWDIWRVSVSGTDLVRLTDDESIDYQPDWSKDGNWIAYASNTPPSLRAIPATGGDPIVLYEGPVLTPHWSPDGRWIYFSSARTSAAGNMDLWRIPFRPSGAPIDRPQRITVGEGSEVGVAVSADGTRLAYGEVQDAPDIWSWDPRTGELSQVTTLEGSEDFPNLAPDGRRMAFISDRGGVERVWALDLSDQSLTQLESAHACTSPQWSPDGNRLAYLEDDDVDVSLMIRRWGDMSAQTVASGLPGLTGPRWSPDGTQLVIGTDGIRVYSLTGESLQLVDEVASSFPTWSPDGTSIAYQHELRGGVREIRVVSAEGGEPRVLAGGEVEYSHPHWSPTDPDRILVVVDHKEVAVLSVATGTIQSITSLRSSRVLVDYPSWSPDGRLAYFSLSRALGDVYLIDGL